MERMASGETPIDLRRSLEYGSQIIHAATTGIPETIYGNVRNAALISNLPDWAIVEVACTVDQSGIRPQPYGALPEHLAAINREPGVRSASCRTSRRIHGSRDRLSSDVS